MQYANIVTISCNKYKLATNMTYFNSSSNKTTYNMTVQNMTCLGANNCTNINVTKIMHNLIQEYAILLDFYV